MATRICTQDLHAELKKTTWNKPVHIYDWTDQMPQLMKAADFVITKAGGLVISESLTAGLPIIISNALPGQEEGNVKLVIENNAGAWAPTPEEVLAVAISWLKDNRLQEYKQNVQKLGRPDAAQRVARAIWGLVGYTE